MLQAKARVTMSGKNADVKAFLNDLGVTFEPSTKLEVVINTMTNPVVIELVASNYNVNVRGGYYEA